MHLSELCEAKGVILVALHPNCTHILQPADVSVFAPLKKGWQAHVREWKFNNNYQQVVKSNFAPILQEVFKKKATPIVIQNGFKKCGLYPFDADAIDYSKYLITRTNPGNNQPQNTSDGEPLSFVKTAFLPLLNLKLTVKNSKILVPCGKEQKKHMTFFMLGAVFPLKGRKRDWT